jgi:uncharacterized protein (DUF58 family)
LLAAWILALGLVAFAYAAWNRVGLRLHLALRSTRSGPDSPAVDLPDQILRGAPSGMPLFEGDEAELEVGLDGARAARGPAWVVGVIAGQEVKLGTGLVPKIGWRRVQAAGELHRGPIGAMGWSLHTSDPFGFFVGRRDCPDQEVALVLPRFTSLAGRRRARELEAVIAAPRAGSGHELFGIREYRPGDSLRRIHWRASARHGELVVREYEPPGAPTLTVLIDPSPASVEVADQLARLAASESWDCIREGGRAAIWAPGLEPAPFSRDIWALLEWLARYPSLPAGPVGFLQVTGHQVVAVSAGDSQVIEAAEIAQARGAQVRAWVVGDAELGLGFEQRVGTAWPL